MGVILLGDKTAAARWLAYAKSRAAALAKQGNNLSQTFSPAEGVTIRVQTLQGNPRVWIEAGGMDYIASDYDASHPLEVPTDSSLYGGRLLGGGAKPVGKSTFGQFAGHNLYPLGGNEFLGGPPQQSFSGAVQLVTVKGGKIASGQAFSPWQDPAYNIVGVHDVLYSGLVDSGPTDGTGVPIYTKRFHIIYRWTKQHLVGGNGIVFPYPQSVPQVAVSTTLDGGVSFSTTVFNINIFATTQPPDTWAYVGDGPLEEVYIDSAVFCGDNHVALIGRAVGGWGEPVKTPIGSRLTLTSSDGGMTWAMNLAPQTDGVGRDTPPLTCAYIGGSKVIGVNTSLFEPSLMRQTYLSTDYGATFTLVEGPAEPTAGNSDAEFSDVVCLGEDSAAYYRLGNFYRTHDAGTTWEVLPVPAEVNSFEPGRIMLRNIPPLPDALPDPSKNVADYASIVMLTVIDPSDQIALSADGGRTWTQGGIIPKRVPNVGLLGRKLPPFPAFPDLHKNGLPIP